MLKRSYRVMLCVLATVSLLGLPPVSAAADDKAGEVTYVIPVDGMIERGLLYVVRRGISEAEQAGAGTIVFEMNTKGGKLDVTEEIIKLLVALPESIKTCTFVNTDALSAGAMIALATDQIYMAPGSRIGASTPITEFGDLPEGDLKEKIISSTVAMVSAAAERKGYDKKLVTAMIRKDAGFKIGDEIICPEGELLTLNDLNAGRTIGEGDKKHPLLSSGTAKNLDDLLKQMDRTDSKIITIRVTIAEHLARWVEQLSILFLIGGLLGLYIEFKTPGFGFPGMAGIVCLLIFFWGHNVAGLAGLEEVLLFVVGVILLALENFVIPGFGATGAAGILCIALSLLLAMVQHTPGGPWYKVPVVDLQNSIIVLGTSLIGTSCLAFIVARFLPQTSAFQKVVLNTSASVQTGFSSSSDTHSLVGARGIAVTPLRPAGSGMFGDKRLDVVARGDYIDTNTPIIVAEAHGNHIVVDKA